MCGRQCKGSKPLRTNAHASCAQEFGVRSILDPLADRNLTCADIEVFLACLDQLLCLWIEDRNELSA